MPRAPSSIARPSFAIGKGCSIDGKGNPRYRRYGMDTTLPLLLAAGAGFLLAVLWFDLMFDVQARRLEDADGEARLTSIADYYRRVAIEAYPANRLVGLIMLSTVASCVVQVARAPAGRGRALVALLLVVVPVALAVARVLPNAMRLGNRTDTLAVQRGLARAIWRDHVACFIAIVGFLVLQLC